MAGIIKKDSNINLQSTNITGVVNVPTEMLEYTGQDTDSTEITVDNTIKKISVDIKGYQEANQGDMLVKDSEMGIVWVKPVDDSSLQQAVAAAESSKNQAGVYATQAGNSAIAADNSASVANRINQQTMNWVNGKFWWGTLEEYNSLESIDAGTFYFIKSES